MASEHWFRWHHGTVTDPKWRVVASRCVTPVTVGHVVAIWAAMVENASQASTRGQLEGWDDEDIAALFGFDLAQVIAIREAMQGKTLDGNCLSGWEKRQPKREDNSTERTREYRIRKRDESGNGNATSSVVTQCDARGEERREEKKEQEQEAAPSAKAPRAIGSRLPADWQPSPDELRWARDARPDLAVTAEVESFRDYWIAKPGKDGRKTDWTATWRNWIRRANAPRGHAVAEITTGASVAASRAL